MYAHNLESLSNKQMVGFPEKEYYVSMSINTHHTEHPFRPHVLHIPKHLQFTYFNNLILEGSFFAMKKGIL